MQERLTSSYVKPLFGAALCWLVLGIFGIANAATSNIPPLPQPLPVQKAPLQTQQTVAASNPSAKRILTDYWGLSYHVFSIANPDVSSSTPKSVMLKLGHHLNDTLAIEAGLATPISDDKVNWSGQSAYQKVDTLFTIRLRKAFVNMEGIEAYGLLGAAYTKLDTGMVESGALVQGYKESTDFAFGFGARSRLGTTNMTGYVEYNRLVNESKFGLSSVSVGVDYYF
ncbi:outer membrane beta-barrel protein [Hydrogenovibrio marinus]|uniref:Outer membrane protein beta-barrel domain-containing protein n=1 Tax=Hydrogenovibrio marinus TaxID=28885 RepID=A0A066ZQZ5_HYDMR|nr:outer membrane beta-barrel protein [Hydrogenovibrio marinus]KDN96198.1 hypothetical protein EI16_07885 [Hydrogenovibrio marinus]BBN60625.1 hypothetical protein HVMH_2219 [Hydrogenovibrio marinus]